MVFVVLVLLQSPVLLVVAFAVQMVFQSAFQQRLILSNSRTISLDQFGRPLQISDFDRQGS